MGTQLILPVVGGFLIRSGMLIPGLVVMFLGESLLFLMLPQVMVHMNMPVTTRAGWLTCSFSVRQNRHGVCVLVRDTCVVMLPVLVPVTLLADCRSGLSVSFCDRAGQRPCQFRARHGPGRHSRRDQQPQEGSAAAIFDEKDPKYQTTPLPWKYSIVPMIGLVMSQMIFASRAVFAMRSQRPVGAFYFKST